MNKYLKSLEVSHKKASNYKISEDTKRLTREQLEHFYESETETVVMQTNMIESIQFACRDGNTTISEILKFIDDNNDYLVVYPKCKMPD